MPRRPGRTTVAAAVLAAAMLAACAPPKGPRTGIDKLEADLVFGVSEAQTKDAAPPGFNPAPPANEEAGAIDVTFDAGPDPTTPRPRVFAPSRTVSDCPDASLTSFPERQAELNVSEKPTTGKSRWKRSGSRTVGGVTYPLGGFESRLLRRVTDVPGARFDPQASQKKLAFTYETVRPLDGGRVEVATYQVNTAAVAGDPEAGVVLKRDEVFNPDGTRQSFFAPTAGLQYLPLPVPPGGAFSSRATDPLSGQVVTLDGRVLSRERVDACGDVLDGWGVDATVSVSGPSMQQFKTHYIVATQLGGIIISQADDGTVRDGAVKATYSLAQANATPLSETEK